MLFRRSNKIPTIEYDKTGKTAVLRTSICTGEKTAGFRDDATGKISDIMLIRSDADLEYFKKAYGVDEVTVVY